jgi:hypothetical protein
VCRQEWRENGRRKQKSDNRLTFVVKEGFHTVMGSVRGQGQTWLLALIFES